MNQKATKSPAGSQSLLPLKNLISYLDDPPNTFSHQNSIDSPYARKDLENHSSNLKTQKLRKNPSMNTKLAFLLDVNSEKLHKDTLLSKAFKKISSLTSISPQHADGQLSKTFEARHITPGDGIRPSGHTKKKKSSKGDLLKELSSETQLRQKHYLSSQLADADVMARSVENVKESLRFDSNEAKKGGMSAHNRNTESHRLRKARKGSKALSGSKDNSAQPLILNHLSYNFSNSPDNSLFMGGQTAPHHSKNERIEAIMSPDLLSTPFSSSKNPFISPTSLQSGEYSASINSKIKGRCRKNHSGSEAMILEPSQKAYLNYNSSSRNWKQCHRKVNSNAINISNIMGKPVSKGEIRDSNSLAVSQSTSTTNRGKQVLTPGIVKSPSKDAVFEQRDFILQENGWKPVRANRDISTDQLRALRNSFDTLLGGYDNQIADAHVNQNRMKKVKEDCEALIENLITSKKGESDETRLENIANQQLMQENNRLQQELMDLKLGQEQLLDMIKNMKTQNQNPQSPHSGLPTEKRGGNIKVHDSPPLTKHSKDTEKLQNDLDQLKQIALRQQGTITTLRKKETKMLRLIYAIRKKGIDVEKIYNEEVKDNVENSTLEETIPTLNKAKVAMADQNVGAEKNIGGESLPRDCIASQASEEDSSSNVNKLL